MGGICGRRVAVIDVHTSSALEGAKKKERRLSKSDPIIAPATKNSFLAKSSFCTTHFAEDIWSVYEEMGKIGNGATGEVLKVACKESKEMFACKIIEPESIEKDAMDREIQLLKDLDHPNIIRLQEIWNDGKGRIHVVMELAKGNDLYTDLRRVKCYEEDIAAHIFIDILKSVRYIHSMGVVHRDLKLQNFVFEDENEGGGKFASPLKLIDFGCSELYYLKEEHTMSEFVGTSYFVAPEVVSKEEGYTEKCDMWSLGVILYMLLCGEPPFFGKTDQEIVERVVAGTYDFSNFRWGLVSSRAKDLVKKLLVLDADERLTAREAFEHPWIQKKSALCASPSNKRMRQCFKSMEQFTKLSVFERLALGIVVFHESQDRLHEMQELFLAMDRRGDGTISFEEFRTVFGEYANSSSRGDRDDDGDADADADVAAGIFEKRVVDRDVERLFAAMDVAKTGRIQYSQFLVAALRGQMDLTESKIRAAFDQMDIDNSGIITEDNLKSNVQLCKHYSDDEIAKIFRDADRKHTGGITYEELRCILRGATGDDAPRGLVD